MAMTNTGVNATSLNAPDLGAASFVQQGVVDNSAQFDAQASSSVMGAASQAIDAAGGFALAADEGFAKASLENNIAGYLNQTKPEHVLDSQRSLFSEAADGIEGIQKNISNDDIGKLVPDLKKVTDTLLRGKAQGVLTDAEVELRVKEATRDAIARRPGLASELTQHAEQVLNLSGIRDRNNTVEVDLEKDQAKLLAARQKTVEAEARKAGIPFDSFNPPHRELDAKLQKIAEENQAFEAMQQLGKLSAEQKEGIKEEVLKGAPIARQGTVNDFVAKASALFTPDMSDTQIQAQMTQLERMAGSYINMGDVAMANAGISATDAAPHRTALKTQINVIKDAIKNNVKGGDIAELAANMNNYTKNVDEFALRQKWDVPTIELLGRASQGILGVILSRDDAIQQNLLGLLGPLANSELTKGNAVAGAKASTLVSGRTDLITALGGALEASVAIDEDSADVKASKNPEYFDNAVSQVRDILIDNPHGLSSEVRFDNLKGFVLQMSDPKVIPYLNNASSAAKETIGDVYDQYRIVLSNMASREITKAEDRGAEVTKSFSPDGRLEYKVAHPTPQVQREISKRLNNGVGNRSNELIKAYGVLFGEDAGTTRDVILGKFKAGERKGGASKVGSDTFMDRLVQAESNGNADAEAPTSNAVGLTQFIPSTWNRIVDKYSPELRQNKTSEEVLALRRNPELSREMAARLAEDNGRILESSQIDSTDANLYLAHFLGAGAAVNVLSASMSTPLDDVVGQAAIKANASVMKNKTVGDLVKWSKIKMGE